MAAKSEEERERKKEKKTEWNKIKEGASSIREIVQGKSYRNRG
jgi:hypothetical protein